MAQDWRANQALSLDLVLELLRRVEMHIGEARSGKETNKWVTAHCYFVISFVLSLRGPEGFLLDLDGTRFYWKEKSIDEEHGEYIYVCLRGQVKGEHGIRCHVLPCVAITGSGIKVKESVRRLLALKAAQGFKDGPAISDEEGVLLPSHFMDETMIEVLEKIYAGQKSLFPKKVTSANDLKGMYQVFRSLRRSSDSHALNKKVAPTDIDIVNRWEGVESARGQRPGRAMKYHYADVVLLLKPFLRYTRAH